MVSFGRDASCKDAELYYYQYLCDPREASIPPGTADHIRQCSYCQTQVHQLKAALADGDLCEHRGGTGTDVIEALTLHFAHMGEDVGCAVVRSFLPALLIPSMKIRIPTPITVHLDDCGQCREDMEALAELDLRDDQLARLSRLYTAGVADDPGMCRRIRPMLHAHGPAWYEDADPQERDHVCTCPRCRTRVYRRRARVASGRQTEYIDPGAVACSDISAADLFDHVVPYGLPDGPRQTTPAEEAVRAHLQACAECVERMQELHRIVYGIAERADSGVTTVYSADDERQQTPEQAGSLYDGYPIHVNAVHREPAPAGGRLASVVRLPAAMWSRARDPRVRPALAAAAMMVLGFTLFVYTRPVSGLRLRGVLEAVQGVENLHVTQYAGNQAEPVQELWIARTPGLVLLKNANEEALFNLKSRQKTINHLGQRAVESSPLGSEERENVERVVDATLGFVLTGIPANRELQRQMPDIQEETTEAGEVYELAWEGHTSNGLAVPYRLRVVLDPSTKLPSRTMMFQRMSGAEEGWELVQTRTFEYPSRQAMDLAMKEVSAAR